MLFRCLPWVGTNFQQFVIITEDYNEEEESLESSHMLVDISSNTSALMATAELGETVPPQGRDEVADKALENLRQYVNELSSYSGEARTKKTVTGTPELQQPMPQPMPGLKEKPQSRRSVRLY